MFIFIKLNACFFICRICYSSVISSLGVCLEIIHNGRTVGRIIFNIITGIQNINSYLVNSRQKCSAIPVSEIIIYTAAAIITPDNDVITEFIRLINEFDFHLAPQM